MLNNLLNWIKRVFGGGGKKPPAPTPPPTPPSPPLSPGIPPATDNYYSPMSGIFVASRAYVTGIPDLMNATREAVAMTNDGLSRAGVDLTYIMGPDPATNQAQVFVEWDTQGYVASGKTGHTKWRGGDGKIAGGVAPPGTPVSEQSATPFYITQVNIYVRKGTKGQALSDLLKHELWTHANGFQHSLNPNDVGHPEGGNVLTARDIETARLSYHRADIPRDAAQRELGLS